MHLSLVVPLLFAAAPSPATVSPALVAARSIEQPYLSPSISFDDVEIGTVRRRLANLGLEIPIQLEGQVNVSLTVGIPLGTFGSAETYRINGYLRSQRLVVEGVELLDFDATIRYRDGVMSLSPLVFRIAEEGAQPQTAGQFRGTAALELVPLEDVSIRVAVETIPVAPLTKQIAALPEISGGTFSGNLQATSPVRQVADVTFWTGDARLSLADWRAAGRTLERAEAAFTLANGTVNIERIAGSLEGFTLAGQGKLALVGGQSFEGTAGVGTDSIQNFGRLLPTVAIPESISAAPQVEATFQGTLNPLRYEVSGQAA
ncbi:MAG: hypothetical protein KY476_08320, partial [Planctomycetes bacterium]|nr:hypothetical protein [Planctomycetota bacterium]